jgi:hypothetical protein
MEDKYLELLEKNTESLTRNSIAWEGLQGALREINDQGFLHTKALEKNTTEISNIKKFWGKITWALVSAVIVLAGAGKVLEFMS